MLAQILTYALTFGAAWLLYGLVALIRHRLMIKDVPKPPFHPIWGHLKLMGEAMAVYPPHVHPQVILTYLHKKYNLPEVWYLDLYPVGPTFLVLATPQAASHAVLTRNYGKHPFVEELLDPVVGKNSFVALNGAPWKYSQQLLAPAFRPSAVRGILPSVAKEVLAMRGVLAHKADTGEVFEMEEVLSRAIFEIILLSLFGEKLEGGSTLMDLVREPTEHMTHAQRTLNPIAKRWRRWKAGRALEKSGAWIEKRTLDRYWYIKREDVQMGSSMTDAILVNRVRDEQAGKVKVTLDQDKDWMTMWKTHIRTLLFGGHGTSTDTLCFAFMLLSIHPEAMKQLRDEHDRVCGPRTDGAVALLRDEPHRTAELEYTTAVLKETLRMYPVGFSARTDDKDNGLMTYNGHSYPTKNTMVVPASHLIGYDEAIYPDPGSFFPTRWLPSSPYPKIPREAFRAFELGPRACMGRELALDEMRAVLLLTVRWFDFEVAKDTGLDKLRATPRLDWFDLDTKVGDVAFQELALEAKPRHGMRMTVKRTDRKL